MPTRAMATLAALGAMAALPWTPAEASHAAFGRIDIYVVDKAFDLSEVTAAPRATTGPCSWLGKGKEQTGAATQVRLNPRGEWEELWVEFAPTASGQVDIDLQGEYYRPASKDDLRLVWADNVSVEGATIANGSFEEATDDGLPVGWRFTRKLARTRYSRDGTVAKFGKSCVAVWYGSQARQAFRVEEGRRYRVRAWFRVIEADPEQIRLAERIKSIVPHFGFYEQTVEIEFGDAASAQQAKVTALPLFNGHEWAVSSRWDDNNLDDLKMRQVLERHGYRGNFYINGPGRGFHGNPYGLTAAGQGSDIHKQLLPGGNAIGAHSWTHPMLAHCSRNRIFEEAMRCRAHLESVADAPVCSYAFSFCNFTNSLDGPGVHLDIADVLTRCGFHHVANARFARGLDLSLPVSWLLPSDGKPIDATFARLLRNTHAQAGSPNISFDMHVWYRTPEAWRRFEAQLSKYGRNPKWWYCNQNEYAAYRHQFLLTRMRPQRHGRTLRVVMARPCLRDLNHAVPLTLEVTGPARAVRAGRAACDVVERSDTATRFHLGHDPSQRLPAKFGWIRNDDNRSEPNDSDRDEDFPALSGLLHKQGNALRLVLRNGARSALTNVRITYRQPLAWNDGVVVRHVGEIAEGQYRDSLPMTLARPDYKYRSHVSFHAAQVDFDCNGRAGRLYLTCRAPGLAPDPSYPHQGFLRLGPIPENEFDLARAATLAKGAGTWVLASGKELTWTRVDPARSASLDVEVIYTTGSWRPRGPNAGVYLLRSTVKSPDAREVAVHYPGHAVPAVFVNGERVEKPTVPLRAGGNRLLLACRCRDGFSPANAGVFLRLTRPKGRDRLTDLEFVPE